MPNMGIVVELTYKNISNIAAEAINDVLIQSPTKLQGWGFEIMHN